MVLLIDSLSSPRDIELELVEPAVEASDARADDVVRDVEVEQIDRGGEPGEPEENEDPSAPVRREKGQAEALVYETQCASRKSARWWGLCNLSWCGSWVLLRICVFLCSCGSCAAIV